MTSTERTREWRQRHPGAATAAVREWRADPANRAKEQAKARASYLQRREEIKARSKVRYKADPKRAYAEKRERLARKRAEPDGAKQVRAYQRDYLKRWRESDPERSREYVRRRRAHRMAASGSHTVEQWLSRVAVHGWRCRYCRAGLTVGTLTMDHAIPLSRGGGEWPANLLPACLSCNSTKHDQTLTEFLGARHGEIN